MDFLDAKDMTPEMLEWARGLVPPPEVNGGRLIRVIGIGHAHRVRDPFGRIRRRCRVWKGELILTPAPPADVRTVDVRVRGFSGFPEMPYQPTKRDPVQGTWDFRFETDLDA